MRRVVLVLSLCLGMLVAAGSGGVRAHHSEAAAADIAPLAAVQADSLVDSYGVGIHLAFLDTPYKGDATAVANALSDLGVRHVRDDLYMDNPRQYAGIKTVADTGREVRPDHGQPQQPEQRRGVREHRGHEAGPPDRWRASRAATSGTSPVTRSGR